MRIGESGHCPRSLSDREPNTRFELAHALFGDLGVDLHPSLTYSWDQVEGLETGDGCHDVLRHVIICSERETRR